MAEDKASLPKTQIVVLLGHKGDLSPTEIDKKRRDAERTFKSLFLPRMNNVANGRWNDVERIYVVRESQKGLYGPGTMDTNGFRQEVMPDNEAATLSDIREWIRTKLPFNDATVRIQSDSDFKGIGHNRVNGFDKFESEPGAISYLLGALILQFQHDKLDYAGFHDRINQPGTVPGNFNSRDDTQDRGYIKENLTIERAGCPGKYPKGMDLKEGAWRLLDIDREHGRVERWHYTVVYKTRDSGAYDCESSTKKLEQEFGIETVKRVLNLHRYGKNHRNRVKQKEKKMIDQTILEQQTNRLISMWEEEMKAIDLEGEERKTPFRAAIVAAKQALGTPCKNAVVRESGRTYKDRYLLVPEDQPGVICSCEMAGKGSPSCLGIFRAPRSRRYCKATCYMWMDRQRKRQSTAEAA
jgi:hypothetical protein